MMTKHTIVSGAMFAIFAATFPVNARPSYGQTENIQMTNVVANVDKTIDTKKAKAGDSFSAKIVTGTTLNDGTNVPPGSMLEGHVDSATPSEHKSNGVLVLTIDKLQVKDGKEIPIKAIIANVATFEVEMGGGSGQQQDRAFDTNAKNSARMNGASDGQSTPSGPHAVPGLTVTSSATDSNSGTLTQAKGNVHLSNENQIQVSLAIVPAGAVIK